MPPDPRARAKARGSVDLFTDWQRRADFPAAGDAVLARAERLGMFACHGVVR